MRAFSVLLLAALVCAAWFTTVNAVCVQTQACMIGKHWDPVQCKCIADVVQVTSRPTTPAPTPNPTPSPSVPVAKLAFNLTLTVPASWSDVRVTRNITDTMRAIATGGGIAPSDVLICDADIYRLTRGTTHGTGSKKTSTFTWHVTIGFSGRANQEDPISGEETEIFEFLAAASREAEQFKIQLKLVSFPTPPPVPTSATVEAVPVDGDGEGHQDDQEQQGLQIHAAYDITSAQGAMTIQTCDDGSTIAATASCPMAGSAMVPSSGSSSSSSSSSARLAMIIAPVVGGVCLLLVFGLLMMVARRLAAASKAVQHMAAPTELAGAGAGAGASASAGASDASTRV